MLTYMFNMFKGCRTIKYCRPYTNREFHGYQSHDTFVSETALEWQSFWNRKKHDLYVFTGLWKVPRKNDTFHIHLHVPVIILYAYQSVVFLCSFNYEKSFLKPQSICYCKLLLFVTS